MTGHDRPGTGSDRPAVRVAVLGTADIARRRMLPAFAACPDTTVAVVAGRDPERTAALARSYGCRAAATYDEPLADDTVDAVYVPLPNSLHHRWARAALLAGKHVLVEKPAATSEADAEELVALARDRGLALVENVLFPHHPQHREAVRLVTDGAIGRVQSLEAAFTVPRRPEGDIRHRPELGGGALWDVGVYPVRAALHLAAVLTPPGAPPGPPGASPLRLVGATSRRRPGEAVDTAGSALLDAGEGVAVQLTYGLDHAYRSSYTLHGTTGRLTVEPAFTPPADHRPLLRLERDGTVHDHPAAAADQVARAVAAFAQAVRTRAEPSGDLVTQARLLAAVARAAAPA
ncbi:Gfo/Idh/MocA family protein [Streptomyces bohaiensis]|uniref:Gfo/Idh/MocA family protein n=1 Tax=Streptomyces bohaiensis TaxID=1431344 RepID=UPI003B7F9F18